MIKIEACINELKGRDKHIRAFVFQVFLPLRVKMIYELVDEFDLVLTLDARGDKVVVRNIQVSNIFVYAYISQRCLYKQRNLLEQHRRFYIKS
jgi:hypothetical protein